MEENRAKTLDPAFYSDMELAGKVLQKIKQLEQKKASYDALYQRWEDTRTLVSLAIECEDESLLSEIKQEYDGLSAEYERMRLDTLLSGKHDRNSAILTLHAGAGGTEAMDWAAMLFRMYCRWGEKRGYKVETLDYLAGDEAGIKSVTIGIEGENAYGYAKCEKGVHRLVRISPFDSSGRRHTSFASVHVMPVIDDDNEIVINQDDLRVDTYRSGGAGGQHVNTTDSAVRITHIPSGVVVACQGERSQRQNRETALKMLRAKLAEIQERERYESLDEIKGEQKDIAWGSQIRSYVFHPYNMVKDHRTSYETGNTGAVMDGELDGFIEAWLKQLSVSSV